jgi:hypothetical protein
MKRILLAVFLCLLLSATAYGAGNIVPKWGSETALAWTDGYTAAGASADLAAPANYWVYTEGTTDVDLATNEYEGVVFTIDCDSSGTTDNFEIGIFVSLTGSSGTYSYSPVTMYEVDATSGDDIKTEIAITNKPNVMVGIRRTGTTDTFDFAITYRPWYWYYY